jgi:hypothetical protein
MVFKSRMTNGELWTSQDARAGRKAIDQEKNGKALGCEHLTRKIYMKPNANDPLLKEQTSVR